MRKLTYLISEILNLFVHFVELLLNTPENISGIKGRLFQNGGWCRQKLCNRIEEKKLFLAFRWKAKMPIVSALHITKGVIRVNWVFFGFVSENSFFFKPPSRYIFPGAEVYPPRCDEGEDDSSSSSSDSDAGSSNGADSDDEGSAGEAAGAVGGAGGPPSQYGPQPGMTTTAIFHLFHN